MTSPHSNDRADANTSINPIDSLAAHLDQLRSDTRGCTHVNHLNNAGSALPPAVVVDAMVEHLRREELIGGYEAHHEVSARIDSARDSVGALVRAPGHSIAFLDSATAAWSRALQAIVHSGAIGRGDQVLVASSEYASNVIPLLQLQRTLDIEIVFVPDGPDGALSVDAFADLLSDRPALVAITHAPSQNGLINDAAGVGRVLRESGSRAWYLLDACQSVGQRALDVDELGCHFLSATGRKFLRGPRGTGFLYVSDRAMDELEPFPLDLNSAEWVGTGADGERYQLAPQACQRYEEWEKSYTGVLGLGAAGDYALALGLPAIETRITQLADRARAGLAQVPGVQVRDRGTERGGIVTFTHDRVESAVVVNDMRTAGINVSYSTPDYALHEFVSRGIPAQVRVSPHVYNTIDDIDHLVEFVSSYR